MQRETRANLIFICVIVCLMIGPVAVTLYKRWGQPGRLIEPPPVRDRLAFIDRTAGLSSQHLSRIVPPETGAYVAQLTSRVVALQRGLKPLVTSSQFAPIMSDGLTLQWVGEGPYEGKFRVAMIAWSGKLLPLPTYYRISGRRGGKPIEGTLESYETQNMPIELRRELQTYGYILPPDGLMWMILAFDGTEPVEQIGLHYDADGFQLNDVIRRDAPAPPPTRPATAAAPTAAATGGLR